MIYGIKKLNFNTKMSFDITLKDIFLLKFNFLIKSSVPCIRPQNKGSIPDLHDLAIVLLFLGLSGDCFRLSMGYGLFL
jgi:hypothetical protein